MGVRPLAYWAAQSTTNLIDIFLQPAVFLRCSGRGAAGKGAGQESWCLLPAACPTFLGSSEKFSGSLPPSTPSSVYCALTLPAIPFLHIYFVGVLVAWYCSRSGGVKV